MIKKLARFLRIKIPHIIKQKEIEKLFVVHPIEDIKMKEYSSNPTKDTLENLLKEIKRRKKR